MLQTLIVCTDKRPLICHSSRWPALPSRGANNRRDGRDTAVLKPDLRDLSVITTTTPETSYFRVMGIIWR